MMSKIHKGKYVYKGYYLSKCEYSPSKWEAVNVRTGDTEFQASTRRELVEKVNTMYCENLTKFKQKSDAISAKKEIVGYKTKLWLCDKCNTYHLDFTDEEKAQM